MSTDAGLASNLVADFSESQVHEKGANTLRALLGCSDLDRLDSLRKALINTGYEVETAENGQQVLDFFEDPYWQFDALILDAELTEIDGLDLVRVQRYIDPHRDARIVVMTRDWQPEFHSACHDAGADACLPVCNDPEQLTQTLAALV